MALCPVHLGEQRRQPLVVVSPMRPVFELPYVALIFAFHAEIMAGIRRITREFTA
jgi:hypothetical protein